MCVCSQNKTKQKQPRAGERPTVHVCSEQRIPAAPQPSSDSPSSACLTCVSGNQGPLCFLLPAPTLLTATSFPAAVHLINRSKSRFSFISPCLALVLSITPLWQRKELCQPGASLIASCSHLSSAAPAPHFFKDSVDMTQGAKSTSRVLFCI